MFSSRADLFLKNQSNKRRGVGERLFNLRDLVSYFTCIFLLKSGQRMLQRLNFRN